MCVILLIFPMFSKWLTIEIWILEFRPFFSGRDILVAGSVGPYGACQADGSEYNGSYIPDISKVTSLINA